MSYESRGWRPNVERQETENRFGLSGRFTGWNTAGGFGFLDCDGKKVFCHVSELSDNLRPARGQSVDTTKEVIIREVRKTAKGWMAYGVESAEKYQPEKWVLVPVPGRVVDGVQMYEIQGNKKSMTTDIPDNLKVELQNANERYEKAVNRKRLWEGQLNDAFWAEFGLPVGVRAIDKKNIGLEYSNGVKEVSSYALAKSGKWKMKPTGRSVENKYDISAVYEFEGIPGAEAGIEVVRFGSDGPELKPEFDTLSPETQQEILDKARAVAPAPEDQAVGVWQKFREGESQWLQKDFQKIQDEIVKLQAPGQMSMYADTYTTEVGYGPSEDEMRPGGTMKQSITKYYLVTGIKADPEDGRIRIGEKVKGVGQFSISKSEYDMDPKLVAQKLLEKQRNLLNGLLEQVGVDKVPKVDVRLYGLTQEEWQQKYQERLLELRQEENVRCQQEEEKKLTEMKLEYDRYEAHMRELIKKAREWEQMVGNSPYLDFRNRFGVSSDVAYRFRESVLDMQKSLRTDQYSQFGILLPNEDRATALSKDIETKLKALEDESAERRREVAQAQPLLTEVADLARPVLQRELYLSYGLTFDEFEKMSHQLQRAEKILNRPAELSEVEPVQKAVEILTSLKQKLQVLKPRVDSKPEHLAGDTKMESVETKINPKWKELIEGKDRFYTTLIQVNGGKVVSVGELDTSARDTTFKSLDFGFNQWVKIGKSGRQFQVTPDQPNRLVASWGGQNANELFFDDGLYVIGRDMQPVFEVERLENGVVLPLDELNWSDYSRTNDKGGPKEVSVPNNRADGSKPGVSSAGTINNPFAGLGDMFKK